MTVQNWLNNGSNIHARVKLLATITLALGGCAHDTGIPTDLDGQSLIIMGYRADKAEPYEGGMLYTGHRIDTLDGQLIGPPPMAKGDFTLVAPGKHTLEGYCFWQLRGVFHGVDDLQERGQLIITTLPNHIYTIQSDIDEYKVHCDLSAFVSTADGEPVEGEDEPTQEYAPAVEEDPELD